MPSWNPDQYLKFAELRTRPARDLAQAVALPAPGRVADLGCGPGNSTAVCRQRWPEASVLGIDHSPAMVEKARADFPAGEWQSADVAEWSGRSEGERFDVIFSNAALQWVEDHATLFPRLLTRLAPRGALAVQLPAYDMPSNRLLRELADEMGVSAQEWLSHEPDFYYGTLRPHTAQLDIWATEYGQVMENAEAIVEWYKGTALRSYLEAIDAESVRTRFLEQYKERLRAAYPASAAGGVLFPFRRIFVIAYAR